MTVALKQDSNVAIMKFIMMFMMISNKKPFYFSFKEFCFLVNYRNHGNKNRWAVNSLMSALKNIKENNCLWQPSALPRILRHFYSNSHRHKNHKLPHLDVSIYCKFEQNRFFECLFVKVTPNLKIFVINFECFNKTFSQLWL